MSSELKHFIIKILTVALILAILGGSFFFLAYPEYYLPVLPWLLVFFVVVTIAIHAWQLSLAKKNMRAFANSSLLATMIRLFLYSGFAIVFFLTSGKHVVVFVICLVVFYLTFTFIEIKDLTRIIREQKKKQ